MNAKNNISKHPYFFSGILFLAVLFCGVSIGWPNEYYAFLLLLYFIVSIGIKLDDISRQIVSTRESFPKLLHEVETVIKHLNDINTTLSTRNGSEASIHEESQDIDFKSH